MLGTRDGAGLANIGETAYVNAWVTDGTSLMRGGAYIKAIKIRGNLWVTRARASRGRGDGAPLCDAGCHARETLSHMLQSCSRTHDSRVQRHDRINLFLKERFEACGCQVLLEPNIPTPAGVKKPDLVVSTGQTAVVLDTTVIADVGVGCMSSAYDKKVEYYEKPQIACWVRNAVQATEVTTGAVVISWRGALSAKSATILTEWGLTKGDMKVIIVKVLEGGTVSAETFGRRTGRVGPARRRRHHV